MVRRPYVAGQFYPGDRASLEKALGGYLKKESVKERAVAVIVPHAGYIYSGPTAGEVYSRVAIPGHVILIGPNHTGAGKRVSVMASGVWETPLGAVRVDDDLAGRLIESTPLASPDTAAHLMEHSLEVQLPFLQSLNKNVSIVPITVMSASYKDCVEIGGAVARAITASKKDVLIVVSSDMNHYEPDKRTREKDRLAIDKALDLDARGLLDVTASKNITMCGRIPAAIGIIAAKELGATKAELIDYSTSGDAGGDYDHVVGYAGILIK